MIVGLIGRQLHLLKIIGELNLALTYLSYTYTDLRSYSHKSANPLYIKRFTYVFKKNFRGQKDPPS
jgi:hypothetical protein